MAKLPQARLIDDFELDETHDTLRQAPQRLEEAAARVARLRGEMIQLKSVDLPQAKGEAHLAANSATMEAYASGAITGKNQAERDVQIADYLSKDTSVREAQERLHDVEVQMAAVEAQLETAEADYKAAWGRLAATRSDAALQTAYLQLLARKETESEIVERFEEPRL